MNQFDFIKRRQPSWKELEAILAGWSKKTAGAEDIRRLGKLYRETTADLAIARTNFSDSQIVPYLNRLVAEGHSLIYGVRVMATSRIWRFFRKSFPEALAVARWYLLVAVLVFSLTAVASGVAVYSNPRLADSILPKSMVKESAAKGGRTAEMRKTAPEISAFITVNNIQVAFAAFALGIFFGIGTIYSLVQNGLLLGALAALYGGVGASLKFWVLILPHGMIELPAIFIAAAGGLMMGDALIRPGEYRRGQALRLAAGRAVILVGGTIPMFVVAGLIEGFITPAAIPDWSKFLVAALAGVATWLYCTGRPKRVGTKGTSLIY